MITLAWGFVGCGSLEGTSRPIVSTGSSTCNYYTSDTFASGNFIGRTSDAGLGGSAEPWTALQLSVFIISSGIAYGANIPGGGAHVVIPGSSGNCSVSLRLSILPTNDSKSTGVISRVADASNWYSLMALYSSGSYSYVAQYKNGGSVTAVSGVSFSAITPSAGDVLTITTYGNLITFSVTQPSSVVTTQTVTDTNVSSSNSNYGIRTTDSTGGVSSFSIYNCL